MRSTRVQRLTRQTLAAFVAGGSVLGGVPGPSGASMAKPATSPDTSGRDGVVLQQMGSGRPYEIQHNICGNLCNEHGLASANLPTKAAIQQGSGTLLMIGHQEVCFNLQAEDMYGWLNTQAGYQAYALQFHVHTLNSECGKYGAAVYTYGAHERSEGKYQAQYPGDEPRGYACILGGSPSPKFWGCTTHLTPWDPKYTRQQFEEAYGMVALTALGGTPVLWGGDLYLSPGELEGLGGFSSNTTTEADACPTPQYWTNSRGYRKVDHVLGTISVPCTQDAYIDPVFWGDPSIEFCIGASHEPPCPWYSDHRLVGGYLVP